VLYDAGHILGSASISLDVEEEGREAYRLWFSGDIGRLKLPLLKDPTLPEDAHYLVMESTYGDLVHPTPDEAYRTLREVVTRTVKQGGKVIIPAFAVGRTQELVYNINRMMTEGDIPRVPVFVDSPLAVNATEVFQRQPELFDQETYGFIRQARHPALNFKGLVYVESREQSKHINHYEPPAIIISASGMADAGRVVHHLMHHVEDPRSAVVIVGWQAPGTTGRDLVDGAKTIEIYGEHFEVLASVVNISGFSAHAGQDLLLDYVAATRDTLQKVILVHSDPEVGLIFTEKLHEQGIADVCYPELFETIEIQ
jgi:metallo-beta-lactamase family protein